MKEMESQTKPSLKLQAYQYLKTKILNCEYRPNEFLNEQKLCAEMGNISRTPMLNLLAVLVGAGQELDVVALQPLVAGHSVGGNGAIGVADVQLIAGVVNRRGDVKFFLFHL